MTRVNGDAFPWDLPEGDEADVRRARRAPGDANDTNDPTTQDAQPVHAGPDDWWPSVWED